MKSFYISSTVFFKVTEKGEYLSLWYDDFVISELQKFIPFFQNAGTKVNRIRHHIE